jgi:hypothetical protein
MPAHERRVIPVARPVGLLAPLLGTLLRGSRFLVRVIKSMAEQRPVIIRLILLATSPTALALSKCKACKLGHTVSNAVNLVSKSRHSRNTGHLALFIISTPIPAAATLAGLATTHQPDGLMLKGTIFLVVPVRGNEEILIILGEMVLLADLGHGHVQLFLREVELATTALGVTTSTSTSSTNGETWPLRSCGHHPSRRHHCEHGRSS